jgi:chromosome segregation ATPase
MSDTPRTDAAYTASTGAGIYELFQESKDIERELNAASKERDDALMMLGMYRMKSDEQKERIKRLEEDLMDAKNKHAALVADVALYEDRAERIKQLESKADELQGLKKWLEGR